MRQRKRRSAPAQGSLRSLVGLSPNLLLRMEQAELLQLVAQGVAAHVEQLARHAVRLGAVEHEGAAPADDLGDQRGEAVARFRDSGVPALAEVADGPWPPRPRPALCPSAAKTAPSDSPAAAACMAAPLGEGRGE